MSRMQISCSCALYGGFCIPVTNWLMKSDRKFKTNWAVFPLHADSRLDAELPVYTRSLNCYEKNNTTVQGMNLYCASTDNLDITGYLPQCADCANKEIFHLYNCCINAFNVILVVIVVQEMTSWLINTSGTARPHGLPPARGMRNWFNL